MARKDKLLLEYPIQIQRVPEGYCAFIPLLKGCKAFGETPELALNELEAVKEGFIDVYLQMGKPIPEPVVRLGIPYPIFQQLDNRNALEPFVVGRLAESPLAHPTGDRCWRQGQLLIVNCQLSIVNYEWDHARAAHNRHMPCLPPTAPAGHARPGQAAPQPQQPPGSTNAEHDHGCRMERIKRTHHTLTKRP